MSYPANLDTIVVRHKIVDTGGKPMKGNSVRAVATKRIWATDGSLIPFETTARVQADGSYEFELPYVDQDGIHNKGVPFQVIEDVPGKPRHYFIAPVLAHGAGPIDATEALVEAPVGYEVKIQAGPVTDEAAAQLLDQDGQFKAALTGTIGMETDRIVPGKVAEAIASDDMPAQAAAAAVSDAIQIEGGVVDPTIAAAMQGTGATGQFVQTLARRTHVTVGPDGDYATLNAAFAAHPDGNVWFELTTGSHHLPNPLTVNSVKNVTISGQGREATTITCDQGFIVARSSSDAWVVRDIAVVHAPGTNTDHGIDVDYPRRWSVRRCRFAGFGGDSIYYRGGIHSEVEFCNLHARDSTNTNGHAGIHVGNSLAGTYATTIRTTGNYVQTGKEYGVLIESASVGTILVGDIAEYCQVGFRFDTTSPEAHSLYTENNTVGIECHNSRPTFFGHLRDEPVLTWTGAVLAGERRVSRFGRNWINPGKAIIYGSSEAPAVDPTTSPSIQWGEGNPESFQTAVPGSMFINTTPQDAFPPVYVKRQGTGTTGWSPLGTPVRPSTSLNSATSSANNRGKHAGLCVWNPTTKRPVWATGPLPSDPWFYADGTVAHTPT